MITRVETENSVYEVDDEHMRIRQVAGMRTTARFQPQGEWHPVDWVEITPDHMLVSWPEHAAYFRFTLTSAIRSVTKRNPEKSADSSGETC